ncbi:MAG: hypothetical protein LUH14_01845 [Clostridiaceae bacterium]|nr:hypothetical protein [Clostridiaceae bacterium]
MKKCKITKKIVALTLMTAVTASSVAVSPTAAKKAEAATKYKAYLCLQTAKFTFRDEHNSSKFSSKLQNTTNKLSSAASKAKFKNVTMTKSKKAKTYTVSLTGLKSGVISKDGTFNTLFVDTAIPGSMKSKVTVTNVKVKFDGKTVKTFKKAVLTPDTGKTADFTQIQIINTWNSNVPKFSYTMPKKSIQITYTIKFK